MVKKRKKKYNFLEILGKTLMILGAIIVFTALPFQQATIFKIGSEGLTTDIPQISATKLVVGIVLFVMGFISHKLSKRR